MASGSEQGLIQAAERLLAPTEPVKELPIADQKHDLFVGISAMPFALESATVLMSAISDSDVEIRPDGIVYLPEIKYRRRLNQAFGPGGWAIMPRGPFSMQDNTMTREYAMYVSGRFVSQAVGEQEYIPNNPNMTYATASEGVRSNAIMRCCKDIGIASELWDPVFIAKWKAQYAVQVWVKGKQKPQWRRKDREPFFGESGVANKAAESEPRPELKAEPIKVVATPIEEPKAAAPKAPRQDDPDVIDIIVKTVSHTNGRGICFRVADENGQEIGDEDIWWNTFHKGCFDQLAQSIGQHKIVRTKKTVKGDKTYTNIEEVVG